MIKLIDDFDGKHVEVSLDTTNGDLIIPDLEELFTAFINAIGIRGFIVEINPEFINDEDGGSGSNVINFPKRPEVH